ncbi:MAG: hypothetical protein ACLT90_14465 [Enterococcus raffinosus]
MARELDSIDQYLCPAGTGLYFLNNAVNHGIMIPLGTQQVLETGKSLLFLVEANGGAWLGLLIAFSMFGTGMAKNQLQPPMLIQFLGAGSVRSPFRMP